MKKSAPLILTLTLDERSFAFFDEQRRRYFPPQRNFIPAHLTLFHHLPGEHIGAVHEFIEQRCSAQAPFQLDVTNLRSLGRGVAYAVQSAELMSFRRIFAQEWARWLTPQDRQEHQPHVTVQNNVDPRKARALLLELSAVFVPFQVTGTGLDLWWYRGGPWEKALSFPFGQH